MDAIADVIGSVGTLVTTVIALFLLRQGQEDRRALRLEQRQTQAALVTCWCDWNAKSPHIDTARPHVPAIYVRNASQQAIYQAFVDYYPPDGGPVRIDIGPVPPGSTRHRDILDAIPDDPKWEPSGLTPRLYFTDAGARPWMRTTVGRLVRDPGAHHDGFSEEGGEFRLGLPRPERDPEADW